MYIIYVQNKKKVNNLQTQSLTQEQKEGLTNFLFGKSDINPLEKIRKEQPNRWKNKYNNLDIKANSFEESKLCPCCGQIKSRDQFFKFNHAKDGKQQHCKTCQTTRVKEAYINAKNKS